MENSICVSVEQQRLMKAKALFFKALPYLICFGYMAFSIWSMYVFGAGDEAKTKAFTTIGQVLQPVLSAIGALFILIGAVRYAIAHSQEDSPSQQKAAMMIGTGIALVVLAVGIKTIAEGFGSLVMGTE